MVFGNVGKSDGYLASLTVNEKGSSPDLHQAPAEDARCVGEKERTATGDVPVATAIKRLVSSAIKLARSPN